jgi:GT2 family glycosyltransferase
MKCLDALLKQSQLPDEVIVVVRGMDGASKDRGETWWAGSSQRFDLKTEIVREPGIIAALNSGRARATSTIVCFTNDRCVPDETWLQRIRQHFEDPLVGAVGGPVVSASDETFHRRDEDRWGQISWWGRRRAGIAASSERPIFVSSLRRDNMAFRKYLLRDFDHRLVAEGEREDDMCFAVRSIGFGVIYDPEAKVFRSSEVADGGDTVTPGRSPCHTHHDNAYVFLKHATLPQKTVFILFTFLLGDRPYPGLLNFLKCRLALAGHTPDSHEMLSALKGKALAVWTYLSLLRGRPRPYRC